MVCAGPSAVNLGFSRVEKIARKVASCSMIGEDQRAPASVLRPV